MSTEDTQETQCSGAEPQDDQPTLAQIIRLYSEKSIAAKAAKRDLDDVFQQLLGYEEIKQAIANKPKGTSHVKGLKLSTGFNANWDQDKLAEIQSKLKPEFFPFKTTYKPDAEKLKALETMHPDVFDAINAALTQKPKKVAIEVES